MIFAWILIVVLIILCVFLSYLIYLLAEQIEEYEENVEFFKEWYDKFITIIADADNRLQEVDTRGSFSSDDEVGFAYETIKECIDNDTVLDVLKTKIKSEGFKRLN